MNILNLPLYYISFSTNNQLETNCKKNGFTNINHFQAIDGRKLNPKELLENKEITIRSYIDLTSGRETHNGIPSLGAIGCSKSHISLWKLCLENNYPYMVILEDDADLSKKISEKDLDNISNFLINNDKSIFVSPFSYSKDSKNNITMMGTHFYIISLEACKELIKDALPIDLQIDLYIGHKASLGKINLEQSPIVKQKMHKSNIQDICVKCNLPKGLTFYLLLLFIIIITILILYLLVKKYKNKHNICSSNLEICKINK